MANTVEVRGGGDFDGALLQNAATEATLQRLVAAFEGRSPGSGGSVRDMYQGIKNNVAAVKQSTGAYRESGAEVDTFGKKVKEAAGTLSALTTSLLGKIFGFLNTGLDGFREASAYGAAFGNSLFKLSAAAAESNLSIEEFTAQIQKNSLLFGAFGGTVTQGAKRFGQLSDTIRKDLGDQLFGMGLTVRDINDYLSAYLDIQMRSGKVRDRTDKSLISGAQNYIVELDKMSKILGVSRREQEAAMRKQAMDATIQQLIKNLSPEAQARSAANIAALQKAGGGDALVEAVKDAATLSQTDQGKIINQAIGREGARAILQGSDNSLELMQKIAEYTKRQADLYGADATMVGGFLGAMGDMSVMTAAFLEKTKDDIAKANKEQEERDAITTSMARSADAFNRIKNSLLAAFLNSKFFQDFLTGLEKLGNWMSKNASKLLNSFINAFPADMMKKFQAAMEKGDIVGGIKELFGDLFTGLNTTIVPLVSEIVVAAFKTIMDLFNYLWTGKASDSLQQTFDKFNKGVSNIFDFDSTSQAAAEKLDLAKLQSENPELYSQFANWEKQRLEGIKQEQGGGQFDPDARQAAAKQARDEAIAAFSNALKSGGFLTTPSAPATSMPEVGAGSRSYNAREVQPAFQGFGSRIKEWFNSIIEWIKEKFSGIIDFEKLGTDFSKFFDLSNFKLPSFKDFFKDINDGITQLKVNLGVDENGPGLLQSISDLLGKICNVSECVKTAAPVLEQMFATVGSVLQTNKDVIFGTLDKLNLLLDKVSNFDTAKITTLMGAFSPLLAGAGGSMLGGMFGGGDSGQPGTLDKIITLIDKAQAFDPSKIVSGMESAYKVFDNFLKEKEKIDGVTESIRNLTKEIQNIKQEFSLGAVGEAIAGAYNWATGGGSGTPSQPPSTPAGNSAESWTDTLSSIKDGIMNLVGLQAQNNDHAEVTAKAARDAARFGRE